MVIHEIYGTDGDGVVIIRSFSDQGVKIEYDGKRYIYAFDPEGEVKNYTETTEPVEE